MVFLSPGRASVGETVSCGACVVSRLVDTVPVLLGLLEPNDGALTGYGMLWADAKAGTGGLRPVVLAVPS